MYTAFYKSLSIEDVIGSALPRHEDPNRLFKVFSLGANPAIFLLANLIRLTLNGLHSSFQLDLPSEPIEIYLLPPNQVFRQPLKPFIESRKFLTDSVCVYIPSQLLGRQDWQSEIATIIARASLRLQRRKPQLRALAFEEALAKWSVRCADLPHVETPKEIVPGLPLDSIENIAGSQAFLDFVWGQLGGHFIPILWRRGNEGIVQAASETFARPVSQILREFFLWSLSQGLLAAQITTNHSEPLGELVLHHASFWQGLLPTDETLNLTKNDPANCLQFYSIDNSNRISKVTFPCRVSKQKGARLVVMNCGYSSNTLVNHDRVTWRILLNTSVAIGEA